MSASKILLTCAPLFWPKMPPLGIFSLQSYLQHNQITADVLDINNYFYKLAGPALKKEWLMSCHTKLEAGILALIMQDFREPFEKLLERLLTYDIIGFSCYKSNFTTSLELARILKGKKQSLRFLWGGPEMLRLYHKTAGSFTEECLELADLIVVGEGELPLASYLKSVIQGDVMAVSRPRIELFNELPDLNALPFPRYTDCAFTDYPQAQTLAMQFSRGCIRRCRFCSERLLYKHYRIRKPGDLLDEMAYHQKTHNIKNFVFFDSLINGDLKKLTEFCEQLITRFGTLAWEAQLAIRPDMDDELLSLIKKSGCYNLFIGLESGAEPTLQKMRKGFSARQAATFFKRLHTAGLSFGISLITGYPGESEADFNESLEFLLQNKAYIPKIEQINPFTYYEGTQADRAGDYRLQQTSLERLSRLVSTLKKSGFKYTNAFIGNLIEKEEKVGNL